MLGMKDMGRMNETQMMKFMQNGAGQTSSSSSSSSANKMIPENFIIIQGGVLQCHDILTGSYSPLGKVARGLIINKIYQSTNRLTHVPRQRCC